MKQIKKEDLKKVSRNEVFMCVKGKLIKNQEFEQIKEFKLKKGGLYNLQYILGELTIYENASSLIIYQTTSENEVDALLKKYFQLIEGSREEVYCTVITEMPNVNVFKETLREVCVSKVEFLSVDKMAVIKASIFDIHEIVMFSREYVSKQVAVVNKNTAFTKQSIVESTGFVEINIDIAEYPIYHHL